MSLDSYIFVRTDTKLDRNTNRTLMNQDGDTRRSHSPDANGTANGKDNDSDHHRGSADSGDDRGSRERGRSRDSGGSGGGGRGRGREDDDYDAKDKDGAMSDEAEEEAQDAAAES